MKTRSILSSLVFALGVAGFAAPGIASASLLTGHMLTQEQIQSIHAGDSLSSIVKNLHAPENITTWADGSRSVVYDTTDTLVGRQTVYIDLDAQNNVKSVEVLEK